MSDLFYFVGYKEPISVYEPVGSEEGKVGASASNRRFQTGNSKLHGNPFFCRNKEVSCVLKLLDCRTRRAAVACILQGPPSVGKSKIVLEALDRFYRDCPDSVGNYGLLVSEGSHAVGVAFGVVAHLIQQVFDGVGGNILSTISANDLPGIANHAGLLSSRFQRVISGLFIFKKKTINTTTICWSPLIELFLFRDES